MRCDYCKNYVYGGLEYEDERICKFCDFEYDEFYTRSDWDILNLDCDIEWNHIQILNRLHANGLPCLFADIWSSNNIAYLVGCNVYSWKIAQVLGIHEECIYNDLDKGFVILNLYQEKCMREKLQSQSE